MSQLQIRPEEFIASYDEFSEKIYRYCYYRVYESEKARDLVQEVFMRAWRHVARGGTIESMQAFLYRIALNCIINDNKKKTPESLEVLSEKGFDPGSDTTDLLQGHLDAKKVFEVLSQLDQKHRDVVIMRYIDDLDPKEIAEITGETANVISVRLHRALKELRTILSGYEEF